MTIFKVKNVYYRDLQSAMNHVSKEVESFVNHASVLCKGQWNRYKNGIRYTVLYRPWSTGKEHQKSFSIRFYEVNNNAFWANLN